MRANRILKVPMESPEDISGVDAALHAEGLSPLNVRAVMCMTESDGFGRGYAALAFSHFLAPFLGCAPEEVGRSIPLIMMLSNERVREIISVSPPRRPIAGSRREILPGASHWYRAPRRKAC